MISFFYILGGLLTLYSFYKTKKFTRLLFLPLLGASYLALQPFFPGLPFFLRFLVFLVALVCLLAILYFLREDYRQAQLDYRRQWRKERKEKMFHVEQKGQKKKENGRLTIEWADPNSSKDSKDKGIDDPESQISENEDPNLGDKPQGQDPSGENIDRNTKKEE